jgi:hypothetical protein
MCGIDSLTTHCMVCGAKVIPTLGRPTALTDIDPDDPTEEEIAPTHPNGSGTIPCAGSLDSVVRFFNGVPNFVGFKL